MGGSVPLRRGSFAELGAEPGRFSSGDCADPLALVKLTALMERTSGRPDVKIGLIDGPVLTQHPDLAGEHLREIPGTQRRHVHAGRQHGLPARDLCRRNPVRKAEFSRARHLPRLHCS